MKKKKRELEHERAPSRRQITVRDLRSVLSALDGAAIHNVCHIIHIRNQTSLSLMNSRELQVFFEVGDFIGRQASRSNDPAQAFLADFQSRVSCEDSTNRSERGRIEAAIGFLIQLVFSQQCSTPGDA